VTQMTPSYTHIVGPGSTEAWGINLKTEKHDVDLCNVGVSLTFAVISFSFFEST